MIEQCPVCGGRLTVEKKSRGLLGRGRRVVRCDTCSSVLRERGRDRWHYAIDITRNPDIYRRFNGKYLTEAELEALRATPPAAEARPADAEPAAVEEAPLEPALTDTDAVEATEVEAGNGESQPPSEDALDAPAPAAEAAEEASPEVADAPAAEPEPEPDAASALAEPPPTPEPASPERAPESEGAPPEAGSFEAPRFIEDDDWHGF